MLVSALLRITSSMPPAPGASRSANALTPVQLGPSRPFRLMHVLAPPGARATAEKGTSMAGR